MPQRSVTVATQVPRAVAGRDHQAWCGAAAAGGLDHLGHHIDLYYPTAIDGNAKAAELFAANRFVITRQAHHSPINRGDATDQG